MLAKFTQIQDHNSSPVLSLALFRQHFLTSDEDFWLKFWSFDSNSPTQEFQTDQKIGKIQFSILGKHFFTGSEQGKIIHWSLEPIKIIREYEGHDRCTALGVCNDKNSQIIASGGNDGYVKIWDMRRKIAVQSVKAHREGVNAISFHLSEMSTGGKDGTLKLWDLRKSEQCETVSKHEQINDIAIDSSRIITVCNKTLLRAYNKETFESQYVVSAENAEKLLIYPKFSRLFVISPTSIKVFNTSNGVLLQDEEIPESLPLASFVDNSSLCFGVKTFSGFSIYSGQFSSEEDKNRPYAWESLANLEHTKVVRMKLESRALSERSFISLGQVSCSEVDLNNNNPLSKLKARKGKIEDFTKGHSQFLTIMKKRQISLSQLIDVWEQSGFGPALALLQRSELAIQANFFSKLFTTKPRPTFINIQNAEAILEVILKLAQCSNNMIAECGSKSAGIVLMEIGQIMSQNATSKLQIDSESKESSHRIITLFQKIILALHQHKRGFPELDDMEFFIEKIQSK
ncbi:unnamed protein product [Blepharisma stoltei]|uniref:Uncharacterized protein n=1 Tax=Blepharisma stoltei TaxID=1481888 RepID=A0AAU9K6J4_9CILI|nr:unnamed protein product [Blepharisma stoltei]